MLHFLVAVRLKGRVRASVCTCAFSLTICNEVLVCVVRVVQTYSQPHALNLQSTRAGWSRRDHVWQKPNLCHQSVNAAHVVSLLTTT